METWMRRPWRLSSSFPGDMIRRRISSLASPSGSCLKVMLNGHCMSSWAIGKVKLAEH